MIRADFYILPEADPDSRYQFLARLAGKALAAGHRLYIHTDSQAHAQLVSDRLWQAPAELFLANQLATDPAAAPITLGWEADHLPQTPDMLINLSADYADLPTSFQRIVEIVIQSPDVLAATRQRFKACQSAGIQPAMHDMRNRQSAG